MKIFNLGSINVDHVYEVASLPNWGETLSSTSYSVNLGGKGLNITVAAHRAGAEVHHIGLVGEGDSLVESMIASFEINSALIQTSSSPTGHANVFLNGQSENCIVIHGGANQCFREHQIRSSLSSAQPNDWLVLQNETNANEVGIKLARELGMKIALVAAPFDADTLLSQISSVDLVAMNEHEAAQYEAAANLDLRQLNGTDFVITYGKLGASFLSGNKEIHVPSHTVNALDTTGAGDTFFGVFLAHYADGMPAGSALKYANAAGALMVQRKGAANVIPTAIEVEMFIASQKG